MNAVSAFAVGLFFGVGLILSGMTDPSKIVGFLDLAGAWDPSLAFVMGGAILVGFVAFRFARKRTVSFLGGAMHLPTARHIDRELILGSLAFGVGWGLAGYCPGPAVVSLGAGQDKPVVFVIAMIAGMALYEAADRLFHARRRRRVPRELSDVAGDA
ncbi:MAG: YeeE/YedE family protein [Burkholderiales bacterium]